MRLLELHGHTNDGLIPVLTDARLFPTENFIPELWADELDLPLFAPSTGLVLVDPLAAPGQPLATEQREIVRTKTTDSLNKYIAEQMALPEVERVYSKHEHEVFYTWVVITERDQDVQRIIYAREKEIIKRFPEFGFDFYVIYKTGADADSLVSGDVELVYSKR